MNLDDAMLKYLFEDAGLPENIRLCLVQGFRCIYCHRALTFQKMQCRSATIDHLRTERDAHFHHVSNKAAACHRCNMLRGNMPARLFLHIVRQFGARLPLMHTEAYRELQANLALLSRVLRGENPRRRARIRIPAQQERWSLNSSPVASA